MLAKRNRNRFILLLLIAVIILSLGACGSTNSDKDDSTSQSENQNNDTTYSDFVKNIHKINDETFKDFSLISKPDVNEVFMTLPETKLDSREKDTMLDGSPSKYIFEFVNKTNDVYIRTSFMYYSMADDGLLLQSIVSPDTQLERTAKLPDGMPTLSTNLVSINGYSVLIECVLSNEAKKGSANKNTVYLLSEENKFIEEIQDFLLNTSV